MRWCWFLILWVVAGCEVVAGLGDFTDATGTTTATGAGGTGDGGSGAQTTTGSGTGGDGATSAGTVTGAGGSSGTGGSVATGGAGGSGNPLAQSPGMLYWCDRGLAGFGTSVSDWQNEAPTGYEVLQQTVGSIVRSSIEQQVDREGRGLRCAEDVHVPVVERCRQAVHADPKPVAVERRLGRDVLLEHLVPGGRLVLPAADAAAEADEPTVAPVEHAR
ncbi:MAG: hypothetical protein JRI23_04095 [Deltaproteobacteria bacterium]|nr:hypothetical protein [Deltaproteobacteria bacterium]